MNRALSGTVLLAAVTIVAGSTRAQRKTAEATFKEGAIKIGYSAPKWQPKFAEVMAEQSTWRLGANDPTTMNLTCGVLTASGCAPAGDYNLAMAKDQSGDWDLVLYTGGGFYRDGMPSWRIDAADVKSDADSAKMAQQLMINVSDSKHLEVAFGPNRKVYPLQLVAKLPTIKDEFAGMPVMIDVLALPIGDDGKVDATIGSASVDARGNKLAWDMKLTMDGETATLHFENPRGAAIAAEIEDQNSRIERMKGRLEDANDAMKERLQGALETAEKAVKALEMEAQMLEGFEAKQQFEGVVSDRDAAATTLTFDAERVEGGMTMTVGAGKKSATFNVKPRSFMIRRRR